MARECTSVAVSEQERKPVWKHQRYTRNSVGCHDHAFDGDDEGRAGIDDDDEIWHIDHRIH